MLIIKVSFIKANKTLLLKVRIKEKDTTIVFNIVLIIKDVILGDL